MRDLAGSSGQVNSPHDKETPKVYIVVASVAGKQKHKSKSEDDHSAPYPLLRDIIVSTRRIFNDLWTSLQQLGCSNFFDPKLHIYVEILLE